MKTTMRVAGVALLLGLVTISAWLSVNRRDQTSSRLAWQTSRGGDVTVRVGGQVTANALIFEIELDTHTVDLAYDLTKLAALKDNGRREYRPVGWEGDPPGGHHRKGNLEFSLPGNLSSVELTVEEVGGIKTRKFIWNLGERR